MTTLTSTTPTTVGTDPAGDLIRFSDVGPDPANPYRDGAAWVEGRVVPIAQARMPLLDSGFLHSDVTYTVAAVWHGHVFRLDDHLDRLLGGAPSLGLDCPVDRAALREIALATAAVTQLRDAYLSITLSRGIEFTVGGPAAPALYVYAIPFRWVFTAAEQTTGVDLVVARRVHRADRACIDPQVKNYQWGDLLAARREAVERGARNALLLDAQGLLAEGPGYNVVLVRDGALLSPARTALPGVTRRSAFDLAEAAGRRAELTDLTEADLLAADEVFTTTTAAGLTPVVSVDGRPVGDGTPGPVTRDLQRRYWAWLDDADSPVVTPLDYAAHPWSAGLR